MPFSGLGSFVAPACTLAIGDVFPGGAGKATVYEVTQSAGAAIGSARVSYARRYAEDASPQMGTEARILLGTATIFRGVIGDWAADIAERKDEVGLLLFDDKFLMQRNILGQPGIGTVDDGDAGFADVGFEIVFNANARPNHKSGSASPAHEFSTGTDADWWTLRTIMEFIFDYYVDPDIALTLTLDAGYDNIPTSFALTGRTALQAVDEVAQRAGESWGLVPQATRSIFARVRSGHGTLRTATFFPPKRGASNLQAGEWHGAEISGGQSLQGALDAFHALSGPQVKETVYTTAGSDPLLVRDASYVDKEYKYRLAVDVSKYSEHNLLSDLSAGSPPKPWRTDLVTRLNAARDGYLTKAAIAADPTLRNSPRAAIPVWLSRDGTEGAAKLLLGGYKIDAENACLFLKRLVDVAPGTGDEGKDQVDLGNATSLAVWITVATVLETPLIYQTETGDQYLPRTFHQVINLPNVMPELRQDAWLPDLSSGNHAITKLATSAGETYVDVIDELTEAVDSAKAATPALSSPLRVRFPFLPVCNIGDRLAISGRSVGATGTEVITNITYALHGAYETSVEATNVTADVQPDDLSGAPNTHKLVDALRAQRKELLALKGRAPSSIAVETANPPDRAGKSAKQPRQLQDDGFGNLVEKWDWLRAH
jgi:hypothetical protein